MEAVLICLVNISLAEQSRLFAIEYSIGISIGEK